MVSPANHRLGDYQLLEQLGEGGMAEVFRAQYVGPGSGPAGVVVVKRIRSELSSQPEFPIFRDMFLNEARLVRRLSHPNLARIFELLEADDPQTGVRVPYIVGEYVKGRDLWTLMRTATAGFSGRGVPPALCAFIIREVARGLGHAHAHIEEASGRALPIIHRDVSPENIMIADDGAVKLIDFGVAKALGGFGPQTRTGIIKGKLAYMAPEQVAQRPVPATDVFGAGIVLYEMLTGRRLFGGPNEFMVVQRVLKARIPPPGTRVPVPGALDEVTMRALERDLARRYRDGDALAGALTEAMGVPALSGADSAALVRWMRDIGAANEAPLPTLAEQGSDLHVDVVEVISNIEGHPEDAAVLADGIDGPIDPSVHAAMTQAVRTLGPEFTPLVAEARTFDEPTHVLRGGPTAEQVRRAARSGEPPRRPRKAAAPASGPVLAAPADVVASAPPPRRPRAATPSAVTPGLLPPKQSPPLVSGGSRLTPTSTTASPSHAPPASALQQGVLVSQSLAGLPAPVGMALPPGVLVSQSLAGLPVPTNLLTASSPDASVLLASSNSTLQSGPRLSHTAFQSGPQRAATVHMTQLPLVAPVPAWARLLIALLSLTVVLLLCLLLRVL